jgi:hypothetical protein
LDGVPPASPGVPPRLPGLLWDGVPDRMLVAGAGTLLVVAGVIVAIVISGGGGGAPHTTPFVPASESQAITPTESTTAPTGATVEPSAVETVLNDYQSDYSGEDLEALKGLFSANLVRQDGSHAPEGLSQALATYQQQFSELTSPGYTLSETKVTPGSGEATATATYSITSQNGTDNGSITFHLVEQEEQLLIDKLTIVPAK